jgi:Ca2+-binding RTX toxin-like protein
MGKTTHTAISQKLGSSPDAPLLHRLVSCECRQRAGERKVRKKMKRIMVSLTAMMVALMLAAPVALAAAPPIYCPSSGSCYGTIYNDVMYGPDTGTSMYGYGGNDYILGYGGNDFLYGQGGKDSMSGGDGNDYLYGGDDNDLLTGQEGSDKFIGWYGSDKLYDRSKTSNDTFWALRGGGSDEVYDFGGSSDVLDLTDVYRSQVLISWLDTSDADTNLNTLRIEQKGTTNTVLIGNYFDNSGGLGKGAGAIESIKFKDKTIGFPASEG